MQTGIGGSHWPVLLHTDVDVLPAWSVSIRVEFEQCTSTSVLTVVDCVLATTLSHVRIGGQEITEK